ncbi:MAG TPA: hypothetical protein VEJ47_02635 [Candidatus Eremiobacteraceae bacterium]|nr:hypothetical protein [Candidatus Eremiobacteraceae bacterium]
MSTADPSHGHGPVGNNGPVHQDVSFEKSDVRASAILKFLVYLGVGVVLSYVLTFFIYNSLKDYWADTHAPLLPSRVQMGPTMPPEPRMQGMPGHFVDPQQDLRDKIKADTDANNKFGWVDQKTGIAQIPVKDAMQLIVDKGLPAVTPAPAEKK